MSNPLKMYFITNMYLSSIQKGIQSAHALAELYEQYRKSSSQIKKISKWALEDKTIIVLNGGTNQMMSELLGYIEDNFTIYSIFNEPELNDTTTSICFLSSDAEMEYHPILKDLRLAI